MFLCSILTPSRDPANSTYFLIFLSLLLTHAPFSFQLLLFTSTVLQLQYQLLQFSLVSIVELPSPTTLRSSFKGTRYYFFCFAFKGTRYQELGSCHCFFFIIPLFEFFLVLLSILCKVSFFLYSYGCFCFIYFIYSFLGRRFSPFLFLYFFFFHFENLSSLFLTPVLL